MRNKITPKSATETSQSATETSQSLPTGRPRTPKASPQAAPGRQMEAPRWLQDGSWTLSGAFSPPGAIFGASWVPPGRPRSPPRAIFGPPGTSRRPPDDPPESNFQQLQPALKKRLTCIPRYRNLCKNTIKHIKIQDRFDHLL